MKKRVIITLTVVFIVSILFISAYAEGKTVQIGNTGITCQVDSKYEVITSKNKKDYSQQLQASITNDNIMLFYSTQEGSFVAYYDEGKDYEQYDFTNKKAEDIEANYKKYIGNDLSSLGSIEDYSISVYDSGKAKWLKMMSFKSNNELILYATIRGRNLIIIYFYPYTFSGIEDIEKIVDSVSFGTPSIRQKISSVIDSISGIGRGILGTAGVIIIWSIVGPSIVGVIVFIIAIILSLFASVFKKRR